MRTCFRSILLTALLVALGVLPALAQTTVNSTTLSTALNATSTTVNVTSASTMAAKDVLFVDREAMKVVSLSGTVLKVIRGFSGTAATAHPTLSLIYSGVPERFGGSTPSGACTRSDERFLPRIVTPQGDVYDCPVGTGTWTLLNQRGTYTAKTAWFNLDNGAGTTIDDVLIRFNRPIRIAACRIVYVDVTTGTVAAGNARVGITVGGSEIVAATAYANAAAVGSSTAMVVVDGTVAANVAVFVRHTGVAATPVGQAYVECDYSIR